MKPILTVFDLEGTLAPEIWIAIAERTGIEALRLTTKDVPDFNALMLRRMELLREHKIVHADLENVLEGIEPFEGAVELIQWIRSLKGVQPIILSDTFYQFAHHLMKRFGDPLLLCNSLRIDGDGYISGYHLRHAVPDHKGVAVRAFRDIGCSVFAMGDSYNDISMLHEADTGVLFRSPEHIRKKYPHIPTVDSYVEVRGYIEDMLLG
jgi:phosphoserine/homoserine phosphotransferase